MIQLEDLDGLISDACIIGCKHVLKEVFEHLRARGFRTHEIVNSIADILDEEGLTESARRTEDVAMLLRPKPQSSQEDDLGFL